jgi:hypothetical protein
MKKVPTLLQFLRGSSLPKDLMPGCANYDHDRKECLLKGKACSVEGGKRCQYFEKAVLPVAAQQGYAAEMNDYYARQTGATPKTVNNSSRACPDCGSVLPPRMRLCDVCREKRRKASYRLARAGK